MCDDVRSSGNDLDWKFAFDSCPGHPTGISEGSMAKKSKRRCNELPVLHPDAAGIDVGASESTSVYWITIYQILESRGFEVCLVDAQHVKNVPGRKTDVSDCQWLQYLHSVGLLRASFRPPGAICALRSLWRHRASLIQMAAEHVLHIQKALDQMNLQVHRVLSDITGLSGLRILDAILGGER